MCSRLSGFWYLFYGRWSLVFVLCYVLCVLCLLFFIMRDSDMFIWYMLDVLGCVFVALCFVDIVICCSIDIVLLVSVLCYLCSRFSSVCCVCYLCCFYDDRWPLRCVVVRGVPLLWRYDVMILWCHVVLVLVNDDWLCLSWYVIVVMFFVMFFFICSVFVVCDLVMS